MRARIAKTAEFGNPEKIIFGVYRVAKIDVEVKHIEAKKAFLVTEKTMKDIGILEMRALP